MAFNGTHATRQGGCLQFPGSSQAPNPGEWSPGSMVGEADRLRRPEGAIDTVAASWTIGGQARRLWAVPVCVDV